MEFCPTLVRGVGQDPAHSGPGHLTCWHLLTQMASLLLGWERGRDGTSGVDHSHHSCTEPSGAVKMEHTGVDF